MLKKALQYLQILKLEIFYLQVLQETLLEISLGLRTLSLAYSFGMAEEADAIENAVNKVLDKGLRTADNMSEGCTCLGCTAMGDAILAEI